MAEHTVAAGLTNALLDFAASKGARRAELLARAGIAPGILEDGDNRVPLANYIVLMRAAKALTGDPALALHFGEADDMAQFSIVGLLGNASETMLEAMMQLNRYGRLVIEFDGGPDRFRLAREQGGLWFVDDRRNPNDFHELTESTFGRMLAGGHRGGHSKLVKQVHVTHAAPAYRSEYERIFKVPVTFDAPWNAIQIDEVWLTTPVRLQPRYVFGILAQRADTLLRELENSKSMRGRVESLLMPILHKGDAGMDAVAAKLAVSRQTLFRKLKAEGTTFEKVLDELRHRLAVDYLAAKKVSVNETAFLVGFSDPAAFSRAFKRWTGTSPRAARAMDPK